MKTARFIFFFLPALLGFGCTEKEAGINSNVVVLGHGGVGNTSTVNQLPPNSFKSITKAIDGLDADGVDIDVQMDMNNILWLFHDSRLNGYTSCEGCMGELSTGYIEQCAYDNNIDQNLFNKSKIVKLEEILKKYSTYARKPKLFLDIKTNGTCNDLYKLADEMEKLINRYEAYSWVEISSTDIELMSYFRTKSARYELYIETADMDESVQRCINNNMNGITAKHHTISAEQVALYHKNNLKVILFGMDGYSETIDGLKKQPDQVITDNIELVFRIIGR